MRIAFFGGTFDPPHNGHLELARHILKLGITDRVLFVPAYDPPHKPDQEISSFADRFAMLELLVCDDPDILISDIERRAALKPSYSVKILKLLKKEFPDDRLQVLIGGDSLEALHTWYKAKEIVAQYEIICYPRKGSKVDRESLLKHWTSKEIDILLKSVLQMPFFDISSTSIRNNIRDKIINKNIKESILNYIKTKGMYL
jgi:nicotinate-nucleotide adenylyltransferase